MYIIIIERRTLREIKVFTWIQLLYYVVQTHSGLRERPRVFGAIILYYGYNFSNCRGESLQQRPAESSVSAIFLHRHKRVALERLLQNKH